MPKHFYPLRELHKFASKIVWALLCAVLALFAFELANHPSYTDRDFRIVERVTDGSTMVIEKGQRVRLIGVEFPDAKHPDRPVEHLAKEAVAFTRRLVEGKRVRLQFDFSQGQRDRYGDTLAYVFLENGLLLNAEIIKEGYGLVSTRSPFARMEQFRRLEQQAREQRRGLWAAL